MERFIEIISGAIGTFIAIISTLFGFLLVVLIILICLNKNKRESVVRDYVRIINALRGKSKIES